MLLILLAACGPKPAADAPAPTACADDEILDDEVCVPAACGAGPWGALADADDAIFVQAGVSADGDGTAGSPYAVAQAAIDLAAAQGGGLVALASGTYTENLLFTDEHKDVTVSGRCTALTVIDGSAGDDLPAALLDGSDKHPKVTLTDLTLRGGTQTGVYATYATVSLARVDVQDSAEIGIFVNDSAIVNLEDVRVTGTRSNHAGLYGYGVDVETGSFTATRLTVSDNQRIGVMAATKATVELTDSVVSGTLPGDDGDDGQGLSAGSGASIRATGSTITQNAKAGVALSGDGTSIELVDTTVTDTSAAGQAGAGFGIIAQGGATLLVTRGLVHGNAVCGLYAGGAGTTVELEDTEVSGTLPDLDGSGGRGVEIDDGAGLDATGGLVDGNGEAGIYAQGEGTTVDLESVTVSGTRANAQGEAGDGIAVRDGARLTLTSSTVQGNTDVGVYLSGAGTSGAIDRSVIDGTAALADGLGGFGIDAADAAVLTVSGSSITSNTAVGVFAAGPGTRVDLDSSAIDDTQPTGGTAYGLEAQDGASVGLTSCSLTGNAYAGIIAFDAGTTVSVDDTEVSGTLRGAEMAIAIGAMTQSGATIDATGLTVVDTAGVGLDVATGAALRCADCTLARNRYAGALVEDGVLTLERVSITDTQPDEELGGGFGLYATAAFGPPSVTLTDSTIGAQPYAAVWLDGAGSYDIEGNALSGSTGVLRNGAVLHGNAVFAEDGVTAWDGATGLRLVDNAFSGADGPGVLLDGASATLSGNSWASNAWDVWQQRCDGNALTDADLADVPQAEVCPSGNLLTAYDLAFTTLYLPEVSTAE